MSVSIRAKIVFITLAILFFALGANTLVSSMVFTRAYSKALESKSHIIAHSLKEKLDRLLKFNIPLQNLVGFEEQCKELVVDHNEISYAMVVDPDGKILFHNDPARMGCFIGDFNNRKNIKTLPDECNLITQDNKEFYGISLPVFGKQGENIAIVRLGFPKELISRQTETIVLYSICVAFVFLSLGILFSLISQNFMIIRPLDRLVSVIRNIRQKGINSTEIVEIKSNDEIGQLGKAFNHMILEINEYQKKIKNHAQELESVVKKRTAKLREANTQLELDIVERKEIEKALRTSEEKYRLLIKNLPSIIYKGDGDWPVEFIDKKGKIEFISGVMFDITERKQAAHEREKLILELQEAIRHVKQLNGLLPICSSCKRIRDDQGYWNKIETYIREHSDAEFTHGICPECEKRLYPEFC